MASQSDTPRRCRLSVAMIVRDEEDVLGATIESVRSIADEILVLDTGSADQTPTIAGQLGASVSRMLWTDDFSAARNRLLAEVNGDWVLWLDAGELLVAGLATELRAFVDREADRTHVYLLMVESPAAQPDASSEQAALPRLMPNHPDLHFVGRVRETLQPSIAAAGLELGGAPGRILRHRRVRDPDRKARNAQRDLKLIALDGMESDGPEPRLLIGLGDACSNLDDRTTARRAYLQAVRHAPRGSTEMLEAYYGLLSTFDGDQRERERQVAICLEALEIYPLDAQLLSAMGSYLHSQNRPDLAARAFETAVSYGRVDPRTWHLSEIAEMTVSFLALTLQTQGKDDDALRVLEEALARHDGSTRIRRRLIDLHIKHGRCESAVRVSEAMAMDHDQREPFRNAIRGASKAAGQDWLAALGLLQSAYLAGCRDPLCLKWLSVTLLSNGQHQAARPVLHEWLQLEPNNAEVRAYLKALSGECGERAPAATRQAVESDQSRRIRIDPGTMVTDAAPSRMPIIHQALSTDAVGDANE